MLHRIVSWIRCFILCWRAVNDPARVTLVGDTGLFLEDRIEHPTFGAGLVARAELGPAGEVYVLLDSGEHRWVAVDDLKLVGTPH